MPSVGRTGYYHATPGRLRVRVSGLRGNVQAARSLEVLLMSEPGINHVRANSTTGNVLVQFNEDALSCCDIMQDLADLGHMPILTESQSQEGAFDARLRAVGVSLGKTLAKAALKQALRGSPAAIILELL
jgi:hypothetical protein